MTLALSLWWSARSPPLPGPGSPREAPWPLNGCAVGALHAKTDEVEVFVTITGGKGTTLRGMAEGCADVICRKLGVQTECHTREVVLLPHTEFYAA
jgi:hypothetical protein